MRYYIEIKMGRYLGIYVEEIDGILHGREEWEIIEEKQLASSFSS